MLAAPIQPAPDRTLAVRSADLQLRSAAGRHAAQVLWSPTGSSDEPRPLVVFFGGGDREGDCAACRALSDGAHAVVLAPASSLWRDGSWAEAFADALVMVEWAADHAAELDAAPRRLLVVGEGPGARMAAAIALHARDRRWPPLARQVLLRPRLDAPGAALEADGPYAAPLRAPTLGGLAPATIVGGDPATDGGRYARRLRAAGVEVAAIESKTPLHEVALGLRRAIEPARA